MYYICICVLVLLVTQVKKKQKKNYDRETIDQDYSLCRFDGGRGTHDHENAVGQDRRDNEEREEWMYEDINCHTPDGIEGVQDPHCVRR